MKASAATTSPTKVDPVVINGRLAIMSIDIQMRDELGENAFIMIRAMTLVPEIVKNIE
jgi:hypothetical protein